LALITHLLEGIAETGSVRAAADKLGISYRNVWGKLEAAETALGQKLVVKNKGHGSVLTHVGEQLKFRVVNLTLSLQSGAQQEKLAFEHHLRSSFASEPRKLRLACSHDLVIEDCSQAGLLPVWDIRYMGSQKAIDALRAGSVDIAGFHLSEKMAGQPGMKELCADSRYFVVPVMYRELGLIVARGNPLHINSIEDLVRPNIHFINRQGKSGTRLRLDELLRARNIDPKQIQGYQHEEFTHSGVALSVAAGAADVAFALHDAVAGLPVDFIPIGRETYFLCGMIDLFADVRYQRMLETIHERMKQHQGYSKVVHAAANGRAKSSSSYVISNWEATGAVCS
jgi:molybdate transport repressor ModE-like protein